MPDTETQEPPVADVSQVAAIFDKIFEKDPNALPVLVGEEPPVVAQVTQTEPLKEPGEKQEAKAQSDDFPESLPNEGRGDKWKQFRKAHEETKKELLALKAEHEQFGATRAERDELKARTAEYEARIAKLSEVDSISRLENDPDFQSKYVARREQAVGKLKELAGYSDIEPEALISVLSKTGKERFAALEIALEFAPSVLKTKIAALVDQVEGIDEERGAELSKAQESLTKRQQERQARESEQQAQFQKQASEAFTRTAASLSKELGIDEATITKAREFYEKNSDLEAASRVILKSFAADGALGKASESAKKIAELESELAKYRESSPGISSGGATAAVPKELDFISAIRAGAKDARII